uniref:Putative conserved protein with signal anchor n=1 Tax=Ixodes ricinus TaxID=34613 RepID=A0A6B0UKZ2_IXORI
MDPWSRRQQPIKVPKLSLTQRYPRTTPGNIKDGALEQYEAADQTTQTASEPASPKDNRPKMEVDIKMLVETVKNRDPSQKVERKTWREIVAEQDLIRAERRKLQEETAAQRSAQE